MFNDDNLILKLPDETVVVNHEDEFLFLQPSKPDWIVVNKNMAIILSYCNGNNTLRDIKSLISDHIHKDDCISLLENMYVDGFFNEKNYENNKVNLYLNQVHLNMTDRCNLNCIYCYATERYTTEDKLEFNDYTSLIDEIKTMNSSCIIVFTGGEPLLSKYTIELARYCKKKNLKTMLLTNGTLINDKNIDVINKYIDHLKLSIDGSNEIIHDLHRGNGNYSKVLNAYNLAISNNMDVEISMTVTKKNIQDIQKMNLLYGNRLKFQPLYTVGNAKGKELEISGIDYYEALVNAKNVEPYAKIYSYLNKIRNNKCFKCAVGNEEISIDSNGNVFPCHMLHTQELCAGNIRKDKFINIYKNSKILNHIREIKVTDKKKCSKCHIRFICGGGCWARPYYKNHNIYEDDNFCDYEENAFIAAFFAYGGNYGKA